MPTIGGGLSPEGSGSKSFPVPGEQGMYGVPGISPDTFPSPTSFTSSGTFDKSPVNQANNQRRKVSVTNPRQFTSPQESGGNQIPRMEQPQPAQLEPQPNQFPPIQEIPKAVTYPEFFHWRREYSEQLESQIALTSERELTSQTEWRQWLETYIEGFTGNLDNAATLMAALTEGKSDSFEELTNEGSRSFVRPHTFIFLQDLPFPIFTPFDNMIAVEKSYLEEQSNNDMQEMATISAFGAVVHQGTLPDWFRLCGLEETDHTDFWQHEGTLSHTLPAEGKVAEYDAKDHEHRSLERRVRYAEKRHAAGLMPIETVNVLKDRLAAANAVRASQTHPEVKSGLTVELHTLSQTEPNQLLHANSEQFSEQRLVAFRQQEKQEQEIEDKAMYLAGLFEAGGSMSFSVGKTIGKNGVVHVYAKPHVHINDNNAERMSKLQQLFGGSFFKESNAASWRWSLLGHNALLVAHAIKQYAPSREEFMRLTQLWDDMSVEERLEAAQKSKRTNPHRNREITDHTVYTSLVQEPRFLAGVVDSRGSIHTHKDKRTGGEFPAIDIVTSNTLLLHAIQSTFGGTINKITDSQLDIFLDLRANLARNLYEYIKPHLILRADVAEQVFSQPR